MILWYLSAFRLRDKAMFSKVWKAVKEVAIAILLVLSLWLVIGSAYNKDIGNLSEWVSAACNIAMAFAAIVAMYKALRWFDSHKQNEAINLGKSLLTEYDSILSNIHNIHLDLISISNFRENNRGEHGNLESRVKKLVYRCIELENNLSSASRWGLRAKNASIESSFKSLLLYFNLAWIQCVKYEHLISQTTDSRMNSMTQTGMEDELISLMKSLTSNKLDLPFDQIFLIDHTYIN